MPSPAAMPSAATAAAKRGADAALNPRTWMLPREVTSMTPLPCWRAAAQRSANASSAMVPIGSKRTSKPSPVGIGADSPGQAPRRCGRVSAAAVMR